MAKHRKPVVGVGLFEPKKDSGVTVSQYSPAQSGTVAPTDKKTQKLHASGPKGSKQKRYHGQQAK